MGIVGISLLERGVVGSGAELASDGDACNGTDFVSGVELCRVYAFKRQELYDAAH